MNPKQASLEALSNRVISCRRCPRLIDYVSRFAKTVREARQLVEAGFKYVCEMDGFKIFRKRK